MELRELSNAELKKQTTAARTRLLDVRGLQYGYGSGVLPKDYDAKVAEAEREYAPLNYEYGRRLDAGVLGLFEL